MNFAYPNVKQSATDDSNAFIGCGRFWAQNMAAAPTSDTPAQPNTPSIDKIRESATNSGRIVSDDAVYETKDIPEESYQGSSLDLAYFLALVNCSRQLRDTILSQAIDVWCTGVFDISAVGPYLTHVDAGAFLTKLRAFLSEKNQDLLFFIPQQNLSDPACGQLRAQHGVEVLSLTDFRDRLDIPKGFNRKTLITLYGSELNDLVDLLFEPSTIARPRPWLSRLSPKQRIVGGVISALVLAVVGALLWQGLPDGSLPSQDVAGIREDLRHGRLHAARQSVSRLSATDPTSNGVRTLQQQIEQPVRATYDFKVRGDRTGLITTKDETVVYHMNGSETGFRLSAELEEPLYIYIYTEYGDGSVEQLYPAVGAPITSGQLSAQQTHWFPFQRAERPEWYPLFKGAVAVQALYVIASRWPAQELLQLRDTDNRRGESQQLLRAITARKNAKVGGCNVKIITLQSTL